MSIVNFFKAISTTNKLATITKENVNKKPGRRRVESSTLLKAIHTYDPELGNCFAEFTCLKLLVEKHVKKSHVRAIIKNMAKVLLVLSPEINTVDTYFTAFRDIVLSLYQNKEEGNKMLKNLIIGQENRKKKQDEQIKQLRKRLLMKKQVDSKEYFSFIEAVKYSDKLVDLVLSCIAASACRPSEILLESMSQFYATDNPNEIRQVGVAKESKKSKLESDGAKEVTKPLLDMTSAVFLNKIEQIRSLIDQTKSAKQLQQSKYNARLHVFFPYDKDDRRHLTMKDLRAIAGNRMYDMQSRAYKQDVSRNIYLSQVLAHDKNSIAVSLNYQTVQFLDRDIDREQEMEGLQNDIADLKTQIQLQQQPQLLEQKAGVFKINGHEFTKFPRVLNKPQAFHDERIEDAIAQLKAKNIKITNKNVQGFGIGAQFLMDWKENNEFE